MRLSPAQQGRHSVTGKERKASFELTRLYRVARAGARYIAVGDRTKWMPSAELSAARLALRHSLGTISGWVDIFFNTEKDADE